MYMNVKWVLNAAIYLQKQVDGCYLQNIAWPQVYNALFKKQLCWYNRTIF